MQADFFKALVPVQQKGRRVPITLQNKADRKIEFLLSLEKLIECSDKSFVSPIVITVKRDGILKLAFESRKLNKQKHESKYQMPNIEELMDVIGQTVSERKSGTVYFPTMDLTYPYRPLPSDKDTSKDWIFLLVGGQSTGAYWFKTGFYGLTMMSSEFQRVMDSSLKEFPNADAFIDANLILSKGIEIEHIRLT